MTDSDRPDPANDADDPIRGIVGVFLGLGILAVVLGLAAALVWRGVTTSSLVLLVVGFGLTALYLFYNVDRIVKALARKRAMMGANVIAMVVLGTVILILVSAFNGCAEGLTDDSTLGRIGLGRLLKHNLVRETLGRKDLTRSGDHELTGQTRRVLDSLDDTLHVLFVDMRDRQRKGREYGRLFDRVNALLEEYTYASPNVVVYSLDALADPDQARRVFGEADLVTDDLPTRDTVVLAYGGKRQDVELDWDRFMRSGPYSELFSGEQVLTSSILGLVSEKKRVVFLRGHDEKDPRSDREMTDYRQVGAALIRNNFSFEVLSLVGTGAVPDDCDVLVIAGPTVALSDVEAKAIDRYLDDGGDLLFLADPSSGTVAHGLGEVLAEYGIRARTDLTCHVWRAAQAIYSRDDVVSVTIPVPDSEYTIQPIVEPLRNRYNTYFFGACIVEAEVVEGVEAQELFYMPRTTTPGQPTPNFAVKMTTGWRRRLESQGPSEEEGDVLGRSSLAVAAERPVEGGEADAKTRVVVIGDSDFVRSQFIRSDAKRAVPANLTLFMNAVKWLGEREAYIAIEPKTLEFARERADISRFDQEEQDTYRRALLVVPVMLIPLLAAFTGFVVWWRRRK